ncbi:hypothetical protein JIN87_02765 [Pelagicoccus mobilis]|uniref:Uncharacterized protein n=1 Tax=Pelagicoccus mobilis TaxID=415221 RepID=A0A934RSW2_9BACT|nr:hypothetical protein [Pelagicoccus mobilis]
MVILSAAAYVFFGDSRGGRGSGFELLASPSASDFNYYQELQLYSFSETVSNDRIAISIRKGKVDFVVLYGSKQGGYPKYSGGKIGNGTAVGHILRTSYTDRIELTGTRKAYEIRNGQVHSAPIRRSVDAWRLSEFIDSIRENPTVEDSANWKVGRRSASGGGRRS